MGKSSIGSLFAELTLRDSSFSKNIDKAGAKLKQFGGIAIKGLAVAGGAAAGVGAIIAKQSVELASDMSEAASKSSVVFGKSAKDIEAWANTAATSMGMSKLAATENAATLGNMFLAMGQSEKQAAKMSMEVTQLAADLASFNNTSSEDAILAIGAAIRGEAEPIRRYGVLLNDANLKAQAFAMGLYKGKGTLSVQAKAMAAYAMILKQTGTAQGDFARTSDGMANATRILFARLENAKIEIGNGLLPVVEKLTQKLAAFDWEQVGKGIGETIDNAIDQLERFFKRIKDSRAWESFALRGLAAMVELSEKIGYSLISALKVAGEAFNTWKEEKTSQLHFTLIEMFGNEEQKARNRRVQEREAIAKADAGNGAGFLDKLAIEMGKFQGSGAGDELRRQADALMDAVDKKIELRAVKDVFEPTTIDGASDRKPLILPELPETEKKKSSPGYDYAVNDYQRRGLALQGMAKKQMDDTKKGVLYLGQIKDLLKAASTDGALKWT